MKPHQTRRAHRLVATLHRRFGRAVRPCSSEGVSGSEFGQIDTTQYSFVSLLASQGEPERSKPHDASILDISLRVGECTSGGRLDCHLRPFAADRSGWHALPIAEVVIGGDF